jgi:hypothetical protein
MRHARAARTRASTTTAAAESRCPGRPYPLQRLAGVHTPGHPDLAGQLLHLPGAPAGEQVCGPDAEHQLARGEGDHFERGRLGVQGPVRGCLGEHGQIEGAGPDRAGQRGSAPLADRHHQAARQGRQHTRQEPGHRGRERPHPNRSGRDGGLAQLPGRGVQLVKDPCRPSQQPSTRRGERHAVASTLEQRPAGGRLHRRHLPGHGRLGVPQRPRRRRERSPLRYLSQHAQTRR